MAVPSSGPLQLYGDIGTELGVAQSNVSLHGMSQTAGFTTPDAMSEFYGYSPSTCLDPFGDGSGISLYKLNGNATDESGLTSPTVTGTTWVAAKYNQGAQFSNSTSSNIYNVRNIYNNYTISFWAKPTAAGGNFVYSQYVNSLIWMDVAILDYTESNHIQVRTSRQDQGSYNYKFSDNLSLNLSVWNHFTAFYGGATNEWEVYVNGVGPISLIDQGTAGNSDLGGGGIGYIGRSRYNNKVGTYGGIVDQMRMFNRQLTSSEISYLYTSDAPCG